MQRGVVAYADFESQGCSSKPGRAGSYDDDRAGKGIPCFLVQKMLTVITVSRRYL